MSKEPRKQVKVEPLELNKETIADLTEQEAEEVQGGALAFTKLASCAGTCDACVDPITGVNCLTYQGCPVPPPR